MDSKPSYLIFPSYFQVGNRGLLTWRTRGFLLWWSNRLKTRTLTPSRSTKKRKEAGLPLLFKRSPNGSHSTLVKIKCRSRTFHLFTTSRVFVVVILDQTWNPNYNNSAFKKLSIQIFQDSASNFYSPTLHWIPYAKWCWRCLNFEVPDGHGQNCNFSGVG